MANGNILVLKSWILHIMRNNWNDTNDIDFHSKLITKNHYERKNPNKPFLSRFENL